MGYQCQIILLLIQATLIFILSSTMAPVEIDTIPREIMAPVMNMKMVEKAFELPLVTPAYTEMAKIVSPITPYVENSLTTITPMVEVGINTNYLASFSLAQVSLKIVDSNLELVEQVFELMGVSEESATLSMLKKIHSTANTIRISGNK